MGHLEIRIGRQSSQQPGPLSVTPRHIGDRAPARPDSTEVSAAHDGDPLHPGCELC